MTSKSNTLDEVKIQVATYKNAVDAVLILFDQGYSVSDVVSLASGLTHLQIKGDPRLSVERLVRGLRKLKRLRVLEEMVRRSEKKLAAVKRETAETKKESEIVKETTIKTIEDEKDAALKSIDNIGARANARLEEACMRLLSAPMNNVKDYLYDTTSLGQLLLKTPAFKHHGPAFLRPQIMNL